MAVEPYVINGRVHVQQAEGFKNLGFYPETCRHGRNEARQTSAAPADINRMQLILACVRPGKAQPALDFIHQLLCCSGEKGLDGVPIFSTQLEPLGLPVVNTQLLGEEVGEVLPASWHLGGTRRLPIFDDMNGSGLRANINQANRLVGSGLVVEFEPVFEGKIVNINDTRHEAGLTHRRYIPLKYVFADCNEQNIDGLSVCSPAQYLVINAHLFETLGDNVAGLEQNALVQLARLLGWKSQTLADHDRAGQGRDHIGGFDLMRLYQALERCGKSGRVLNQAGLDGVRRERFNAGLHDLQGTIGILYFEHFDRACPDVQGQIGFLSSE